MIAASDSDKLSHRRDLGDGWVFSFSLLVVVILGRFVHADIGANSSETVGIADMVLGPSTPTPTATPNLETPILRVSSVHGTPGDSIEVGVSLDTVGHDIAAVQNDVIFDPQALSFGAATERPQCRVNTAIHKSETAFGFLCRASAACEGIRAIVISLYTSERIPDDALLYACTVQIARNAVPGRYPLHITNVAASDPKGLRIPLEGVDGEVIVDEPTLAAPQAQGVSSAPAGGSGCAVGVDGDGSMGGAAIVLLLLVLRRRVAL
ncbi:MAG TPA: hypothetical protein VMW17_16705 [Candidatus Binatia bacterium]|nr:hypothetical protein [Candidatus Binatia bacterium]